MHELLERGLIRENFIPCVVPTALAPKKGVESRMCTNSRSINWITIKYRLTLPTIDGLMDCLSGVRYFTKKDLKSGYHQIIIREGDERKTMFNTKEGLFECLVMSFCLTNFLQVLL